MNKISLWKIIFVLLFVTTSAISFYDSILSYDPFKVFMGTVFLLFLIYQIFSFRENFNKIFYFLMISGIFALCLIIFYNYWYAVYGLYSPFFLSQIILVFIISLGVGGIYWEDRPKKKRL
ncbi:hypothetical protein [Methanobacterium alcaliphilum]|uniref:hypothetical protein n=1 Tax=Methanobacterium alcaliphilum TaxID=392018 RepID=UPI00200B289E|nr:hypothetical protein [Methanobacterium alcaliphilum]MCK9151976.1 hypothetical protein [Methanobacterium alcaliphilum]